MESGEQAVCFSFIFFSNSTLNEQTYLNHEYVLKNEANRNKGRVKLSAMAQHLDQLQQVSSKKIQWESKLLYSVKDLYVVFLKIDCQCFIYIAHLKTRLLTKVLHKQEI